MFNLSALLSRPAAPRPTWGLPEPDGHVALTIGGRICWPNAGDALNLDATMLRQHPTREIVTTTDWPGLGAPQHFRGAALMDVLRTAGWRGQTLVFEGADDYRIDASLSSLKGTGALLATEHNGMPMHCTRHGPLWLVFDYDAAPDRVTRWHQRAQSVWGLGRIEVQ